MVEHWTFNPQVLSSNLSIPILHPIDNDKMHEESMAFINETNFNEALGDTEKGIPARRARRNQDIIEAWKRGSSGC